MALGEFRECSAFLTMILKRKLADIDYALSGFARFLVLWTVVALSEITQADQTRPAIDVKESAFFYSSMASMAPREF